MERCTAHGCRSERSSLHYSAYCFAASLGISLGPDQRSSWIQIGRTAVFDRAIDEKRSGRLDHVQRIARLMLEQGDARVKRPGRQIQLEREPIRARFACAHRQKTQAESVR